MKTEDKLKAIIQAQVKGGYKKWQRIATLLGTGEDYISDLGMLHNKKSTVDYNFPLVILLDTNGLRAAYGESKYIGEIRSVKQDSSGRPAMSPSWSDCSFAILDSWNSDKNKDMNNAVSRYVEGNNYEAAIDTAYSLLSESK